MKKSVTFMNRMKTEYIVLLLLTLHAKNRPSVVALFPLCVQYNVNVAFCITFMLSFLLVTGPD